MRETFTAHHVSGPAVEPVTLTEAKLARRMDLDDTSQDAILRLWIASARIEAERELNAKIGRQTWDIVMGSWPDYRISDDPFRYRHLWIPPIRPLIAAESISFRDIEGNQQTVNPASYVVVDGGISLRPGYLWPSGALYPWRGITFRLTVGIEPSSDGASPPTLSFPANIRLAMLYRIGTYDRVREDVTLGTTMVAGKVGTFEQLLSGDKTYSI